MKNVELQAAVPRLLASGCTAASISEAGDRPDLVLTHPNLGVVSVLVSGHADSIDDCIRSLNRSIATLRTEIPEIELLPDVRVVVSERPPPAGARLGKVQVVSGHDLAEGTWLDRPSASAVDKQLLEKVASRLQPQMRFIGRPRQGSSDVEKAQRKELRFVLDGEQSAVAQRSIEDVLLITGPPGSGKTLVLVARARWLSTLHPEWQLLVLVYNHLLARHLEKMLEGHPNVQVSTFGLFARSRGHRISLNEDSDSKREVRAILDKGFEPTVDALFIDEWQDFQPAWVEYALAHLHSERGGACFAGDEKQAIYRDDAPLEALRTRKVERVHLNRPYRSTRQILEVVGRLTETFETSSADLAPEGVPVELIWAEDWDGQAAAIAWEVERMLESGEREPEGIAVLGTQRKAIMNRMAAALEARNIGYKMLDGSELPDPRFVSVLTVHQSKGYEFDVVLLMGLEALPKLTDQLESKRRCRVGFVGPTRARDLLMMTYTRTNEFLRNLRDCTTDTYRAWNYPDDYPGN